MSAHSARLQSPGAIEAEFIQAVTDAGIPPPDHVIVDGTIKRFQGSGKNKQHKCGWYILYPDSPVAGAFGDWRLDIDQTWCSASMRDLPEAERKRILEQQAANATARKMEQRTRQAAAAHLAQQIWDKAKPADPGHPYLKAKQVKPHHLRQSGNTLLLPIYGEDKRITSLQKITVDGSKKFLPDGKISGCYSTIGTPRKAIYICEGFATAASIHAVTGHAVAIALNAGNLAKVAKILRRRFPAIKIVIACDNDHMTPGNPGIKKGREAAALVNGYLAVPPELADCSDWNDIISRHTTGQSSGPGPIRGTQPHDQPE